MKQRKPADATLLVAWSGCHAALERRVHVTVVGCQSRRGHDTEAGWETGRAERAVSACPAWSVNMSKLEPKNQQLGPIACWMLMHQPMECCSGPVQFAPSFAKSVLDSYKRPKTAALL